MNWTAVATFGYDQKAQMTSGDGRSLAWKSFGKPESASKGANSVTWVYGPDDERVRQTLVTSGGTATTDYVNGGGGTALVFESETKAGITQNRHYLSAGGQPFAIHKTFSGPGAPPAQVQYLHSDQLGSIAAVTNAAGAIVRRFSYDPWGKRQFTNGAPDTGHTLNGQETDRGFTGHEHVDEVGLINMNGRVYDPKSARFASADPFVQAPTSIQSYNRYSYGMNNPVLTTDPTGYLSFSDFRRTFDPVYRLSWASAAARVGAVEPGAVPG